jgi:hypothetical protein
LLGPIEVLPLAGIHWVIVGGESGPGARPMDPKWVKDNQKQCRKLQVPFFFKQWGGVNKKRAGRVFDGKTWDGMPGSVEQRPESGGRGAEPAALAGKKGKGELQELVDEAGGRPEQSTVRKASPGLQSESVAWGP